LPPQGGGGNAQWPNSTRRTIALTAAPLLATLLAISTADYLQLPRTVPAMAAPSAQATVIVVDKTARTLTLFHDADVIKTYGVSLGRKPIGPKQREGDHRTPEGHYVIDSRNPRSSSHLALHVSYPDAADRAQAQRLGVSPGGDIMIHGLRNGLGWLGTLHRALDWTDGCIAVTNLEMDEIWSL